MSRPELETLYKTGGAEDKTQSKAHRPQTATKQNFELLIQKKSRLLSSHLSKQKINVVVSENVEPDVNVFLTKLNKVRNVEYDNSHDDYNIGKNLDEM